MKQIQNLNTTPIEISPIQIEGLKFDGAKSQPQGSDTERETVIDPDLGVISIAERDEILRYLRRTGFSGRPAQ